MYDFDALYSIFLKCFTNVYLMYFAVYKSTFNTKTWSPKMVIDL